MELYWGELWYMDGMNKLHEELKTTINIKRAREIVAEMKKFK